MGSGKSTLIVIGALLALLGIAGLAIPEFSTQQQKNVAQIGSLKIQAQEDTWHYVPPAVAGGALLLGLVLIGGGLVRRT